MSPQFVGPPISYLVVSGGPTPRSPCQTAMTRGDSLATSRRSYESGRRPLAWWRPAGSTTLAQFVQDRRGWAETAIFSRPPRCRQGGVKRATLLIGQAVTLVVRDKVDDGAVGQSRRLIKNEATLFDASSERAHAGTVRLQGSPGRFLSGLFPREFIPAESAVRRRPARPESDGA